MADIQLKSESTLIKKVSDISKLSDIDFVFTVSEDEEKLPARLFEYAQKA